MSVYGGSEYPSPNGKTQALTIWQKVALSPSVETFSAYKNEADLGRAVVWIIITTLITTTVSVLTTAFSQKSFLRNMDQIRGFLPPEVAREIPDIATGAAPRLSLGTALCGIPTGVIMGLIGAFIGVGLVHLAAKLLQGEGTYTETFFLTAAASAPITLATGALQLLSALFGLIPVIGGIFGALIGLVTFAISIYGLVLSAMAVAAAHRFTLGKGFASVLLPTVVILLLLCCGFGAMVALLVALGGSMEEIMREISAFATVII